MRACDVERLSHLSLIPVKTNVNIGDISGGGRDRYQFIAIIIYAGTGCIISSILTESAGPVGRP